MGRGARSAMLPRSILRLYLSAPQASAGTRQEPQPLSPAGTGFTGCPPQSARSLDGLTLSSFVCTAPGVFSGYFVFISDKLYLSITDIRELFLRK
ncbi:hypothetical protein NDU88_002995 [Pleurodeles waltl]|uniref:Uncharacterized protein n=1 Tax=Pleurodeles waltl TaxID=8319 RepID=A0AAV7W0W4_PLEWA|nr:hypothetical protein NDU88_002995 [Pleurodeles waltl]